MTQSNIFGLVALAVGALLLFFTWRASNAPLEQLVRGHDRPLQQRHDAVCCGSLRKQLE
jgi:HAMP domain-containing protein